jgi:hypothetical protein
LEKGCQINFYIEPEELVKNRFHFYIDAARRPGFLATYRLSYVVNGVNHLVNAVCGFHQLDPTRKGVFVWHDFTLPSITTKVNEKRFVIEQSNDDQPQNLRWFYFIRRENEVLTQDSKENIQWFTNFFNGKKVKWLSPGGDSKQDNAPWVQAQIYTKIEPSDKKVDPSRTQFSKTIDSVLNFFTRK